MNGQALPTHTTAKKTHTQLPVVLNLCGRRQLFPIKMSPTGEMIVGMIAGMTGEMIATVTGMSMRTVTVSEHHPGVMMIPTSKREDSVSDRHRAALLDQAVSAQETILTTQRATKFLIAGFPNHRHLYLDIHSTQQCLCQMLVTTSLSHHALNALNALSAPTGESQSATEATTGTTIENAPAIGMLTETGTDQRHTTGTGTGIVTGIVTTAVRIVATGTATFRALFRLPPPLLELPMERNT